MTEAPARRSGIVTKNVFVLDANTLQALLDRVPAAAVTLYCYLALHNAVSSSVATMAQALHVSAPTIHAHLRALESAGFIEVTAQYAPDGARIVSKYHVYGATE